MTPDKDLAARLAELAAKENPDLCSSWPLKNALFDAHRTGQLITRAEADAMVAAAWERCARIADYAGAKQVSSDGSYSHHEPVMGPDVADEIRAAQPAPAKGGE